MREWNETSTIQRTVRCVAYMALGLGFLGVTFLASKRRKKMIERQDSARLREELGKKIDLFEEAAKGCIRGKNTELASKDAEIQRLRDELGASHALQQGFAADAGVGELARQVQEEREANETFLMNAIERIERLTQWVQEECGRSFREAADQQAGRAEADTAHGGSAVEGSDEVPEPRVPNGDRPDGTGATGERTEE